MTRRRFEIQKVYKLKEPHFSSTECAGILLDFEVPLNVQAAFRKFFFVGVLGLLNLPTGPSSQPRTAEVLAKLRPTLSMSSSIRE